MSNTLKTFLLLGTLGATLVGLGWAIGGPWPWIALAMATLMNVGAYFFSDRIVLRMHNAKPVTREEMPELHAMLEELATRAKMPVPKLYRMADPSPNAFATGRDPAHGVVAVTDGLLALLDKREIRGVLAHELAHIQRRDILVGTIGAVLAGAVSHIASMLQWTALLGGGSEEEDGGGGLGALLFAMIAGLGATLLQFAVSRAREYGADAWAAELTGDPEALARALYRLEHGKEAVPAWSASPATASLFIVSPFAGGAAGLARWFSTHPASEERIRRLLAMRSARAA